MREQGELRGDTGGLAERKMRRYKRKVRHVTATSAARAMEWLACFLSDSGRDSEPGEVVSMKCLGAEHSFLTYQAK